jgi:hypothetical protein
LFLANGVLAEVNRLLATGKKGNSKAKKIFPDAYKSLEYLKRTGWLWGVAAGFKLPGGNGRAGRHTAGPLLIFAKFSGNDPDPETNPER